MATEQELSDFLKSVEKRAFKRAVWQVRDDDAALDIVQDSMLKLAQRYGDRPAQELPLLFQRILANQTMDWFRRQKTRDAHLARGAEAAAESAETSLSRREVLHLIEKALQELPARQREAFLLRYWEELDVAETAAVMGCSAGSVKTHCSRATQALARTLQAQGISP